MKTIKTYVVPRPFYGYNIPIAMQSSYLRDYAARNNYKFTLPVTEISKINSFAILNGALKDKNQNLSDLAMVSIFILPIFDKKKINFFFNASHLKEIKLHFVLESYIFTLDQLYEWIENTVPIINIANDFSSLKKINYLYD